MKMNYPGCPDEIPGQRSEMILMPEEFNVVVAAAQERLSASKITGTDASAKDLKISRLKCSIFPLPDADGPLSLAKDLDKFSRNTLDVVLDIAEWEPVTANGARLIEERKRQGDIAEGMVDQLQFGIKQMTGSDELPDVRTF